MKAPLVASGLVLLSACAFATPQEAPDTLDNVPGMPSPALPSLVAGELVFLPDLEAELGPPLVGDSVVHAITPRLLPADMSFFERWAWGDSGMFRTLGIASPLTPEVRKHELNVRRTMLTMHQIGGFVTLGLMLTTDYFGQRYLSTGQRTMLSSHQAFLTATISSYALTAALAVLSPPPLLRREGDSGTTGIHKTLAWIHVAGMIVTPILGAAINRRSASFQSQARFHQVSAYITTGVFAASVIVLFF